MQNLKIRRIGNSLGAIFPKELLQKLKVGEGDKIFVTETANGIQITTYDPNYKAAMQAFAETRKQYCNAMRELAR